MTNTQKFKMPARSDLIALDAVHQAVLAVDNSVRMQHLAGGSLYRTLQAALEVLIGGHAAREVLNMLIARTDLDLIEAVARVHES